MSTKSKQQIQSSINSVVADLDQYANENGIDQGPRIIHRNEDGLTSTYRNGLVPRGYDTRIAGGANESLMRGSTVHQSRRTADNETAIYLRVLRTGDPGAAAELRASNDTTMNITTGADGGDLVPTGHFQGIVAKARPQSLYPVLGVRMIPGDATTINVPTDDEDDDGAFVLTAESAQYDRDAPAVTQQAMTVAKYTKRIELTEELIWSEDSQLEEFLQVYVAAGMAATMNTLLVTEALASGTAALTFDSATVIAAAEVPELLYLLPDAYARGPNIAWLATRATEGELRGLLSANQFQFAPNPAGQVSPQSQLFDERLYTDGNMGATAASAKSLLIGNWSYMAMRLSPGMQFLRDPFTRGQYGEVLLYYSFRAVFSLTQAASIQYGTHPTA